MTQHQFTSKEDAAFGAGLLLAAGVIWGFGWGPGVVAIMGILFIIIGFVKFWKRETAAPC